ncbi:MAG: M36 family metallopeptidase, partial [Blastocatellia bacterium]|nr:M36 family metallopeptidase [Blastocatellia bacterium]
MQFSGFFRKHRAILFLIILLLMSALPKYLSSEADTHLSDEGFEGSRFPNFDIRAKQFTDVTLTSNNLSEVDFGDVGLASRLNGRLKLEEAKVQLQTLKQKVSGLQLRWSELQETPRTIFSYQMPLTETSTATTESIARRFISNNNVLYGFDGTSNDLKIVRNYTTRHNGLRHLVLQQESNGLQVFGAEARFTIDAKGQVVMVASDLAPSISSTIINTVAKITALQALKLAAENVELVLDERVKVASKSDSVERATTFTSGNSFANSPTARLMLFPMSKGNVRLAWQVRLASRYSPDSFAVFIDAEKGTVLLRQNMTWYFADRPQFRVFTTPSPQPNIPFVSLNPALVARELAVETADPIASPKGWLDPANPTTVGNNVIAQEDLDANNVGGFRPVAQNLLFDYPLTLATVGQEPEMFQAASVTNLFYRCNLIHDYLYRLGFDEAAGNFQVDNFGRGGLG